MKEIVEIILFMSCLFIITGNIIITIKTRFIQFRLFRVIKNAFLYKNAKETSETITPRKALFTAMSTTLGISSIAGPVMAINLGGPGALLYFLLIAFFGSAATYTEVHLSLEHRKRFNTGAIKGGPMQYIENLLSPAIAKWYAFSCFLLMITWSGSQANQLAAILNSSLLGSYRFSPVLSGSLIALCILMILVGGIKRVGAFSAKIVPIMFLLYIGGSLYILFLNADQLGSIFHTMFSSAFSPMAIASGLSVGGVVAALRWGVFKGMQACEAGIGTQAIPHSMAETPDPKTQGALAMLSTYTAGLVAFLSGCVALVTNTWQDPEIPLGIGMVVASFKLYFSSFGVTIIALSTFLFGFGTILGNSYNGGQCFSYLTDNKKRGYYLAGVVLMIFMGAISDVKTFWSLTDLVLVSMSVPHMLALLVHTFRKNKLAIPLTK